MMSTTFLGRRLAKAALRTSTGGGGGGRSVARPTRQQLLLRCVTDGRTKQTSTTATTSSCNIIRQSHTGSQQDAEISECARSLSLMGQHREQRGAAIATDFAKLLSPEARREVADAAQKAFAASSSTNAAAEAPVAEVAAAANGGEVPKPSRRDLKLIALNSAIPFVGFGFMDNAILILAGDAIDNSLGVVLGISTLCAAALGNIVSDVAGVGLGTIIEDYCARLGIPQPNLSQAQRQLRSVRFTNQFGTAFGLTVGCVIGMCPLLFLDSEKAEKAKDELHLDDIFKYMVTEAKELIGAEYTCLYLVVDSEKDRSPKVYTEREMREGGYLYGKYVDGSEKHAHVPIGKGVLSSSALSGKIANLANMHRSDGGGELEENDTCNGCSSDVAKALGISPKSIESMACVPVRDARGNVVAVIQAINKVGTGTVPSGQFLRRRNTKNWKDKGFTNEDVQVLRALATRISISLESMHAEHDKVHLRDTIQILKEHGTLEVS